MRLFIDWYNIIVLNKSQIELGNYARIDDVSTMPAEQRKGYATQLICAALKHALSLNINTCFLEASSSGLGVYKRIGFEELFINHYYESQ